MRSDSPSRKERSTTASAVVDRDMAPVYERPWPARPWPEASSGADRLKPGRQHPPRGTGCRPAPDIMRRLLRWFLHVAVVVSALALVDRVYAHDSLGRALPRIDQTLVNVGDSEGIHLRITDADSGAAIPRLVVEATADRDGGHDTTQLVVRKVSAVAYLVPLRLRAPGTWRVHLSITGEKVAPEAVSIDVSVSPSQVRSSDDRPASDSRVILGILVAGACIGISAVVVIRRRAPRG
jgi:hypothetical protein